MVSKTKPIAFIPGSYRDLGLTTRDVEHVSGQWPVSDRSQSPGLSPTRQDSESCFRLYLRFRPSAHRVGRPVSSRLEGPVRTILFPSLVLMLSACDGSIVNTQINVSDDTGDMEGAPNIYVEATAVDFDAIGLEVHQVRFLNIQNNGVSTLTVEAITSDNSVFTATAGAGLQIAPGLTTSVGLKYLPTAYGEYTGTLTILTKMTPMNPKSL